MAEIIHLYGASGSGTTTLGKHIADKLGWQFLDTDNYLWQLTDPPYTTTRPAVERVALIREDIRKAGSAVLSGSLSGWGDELTVLLTLAVRLDTNTNIRLERLRKREASRFGQRIAPGGDMHQHHLAFLAWAAAYDEGGLSMRSRAAHDEWEKRLPCRKLTVNGANSVEHNWAIIKKCLTPG